jgi:hypothetical protein
VSENKLEFFIDSIDAEADLEEEEFNKEANIVFGNSSQLEPNVESIQIEKESEDVMGLN